MRRTCVAVVAFMATRNPCKLPASIQHCSLNCVAVRHGRPVSEAAAWLTWIVDNYNSSTANVIYFLHNHDGDSWHRSARLPLFTGTSKAFGTQIMQDKWEYGHERPMLEWFAVEFLGMTSGAMIRKYRLHEHRCCSESMVLSKDLRATSEHVYRALLSQILKMPMEPWGWVCERLWPILFHLSVPK